ncbi:hypothetical protein NUW54_g4272 [Trametes sanguinea]|uniref:Uncharacterized protein n=1 Tax=Trametes sanguinea TaxID=158606 RepID=A0ACC1PZY8_9APHY|nr:hypothetical protein NUW54_g4272 [Trametes sanguinea]
MLAWHSLYPPGRAADPMTHLGIVARIMGFRGFADLCVLAPVTVEGGDEKSGSYRRERDSTDGGVRRTSAPCIDWPYLTPGSSRYVHSATALPAQHRKPSNVDPTRGRRLKYVDKCIASSHGTRHPYPAPHPVMYARVPNAIVASVPAQIDASERLTRAHSSNTVICGA